MASVHHYVFFRLVHGKERLAVLAVREAFDSRFIEGLMITGSGVIRTDLLGHLGHLGHPGHPENQWMEGS